MIVTALQHGGDDSVEIKEVRQVDRSLLYRDKIDAVVDYPLRGLDLSP